MSNVFLPPRPASQPTIYANKDTHPQFAGLLKVGYTTRIAKARLDEIYPVKTPGRPPYRIVLEEAAMRGDGTIYRKDALKVFENILAAAGYGASSPKSINSWPCATSWRQGCKSPKNGMTG